MLALWAVLILPVFAETDSSNSRSVEVVLVTDLGEIVIEVYEKRAPKTSAYFLDFVDSGDYNGAKFYRAASLDRSPGVQLIQGGMLIEGLNSTDPVSIDDFDVPVLEHFETTRKTGLKHEYATVSLARDLLATGHVIPEIVICFRAIPEMDYGGRNKPDERGFPAFGKVVRGMDVAQKISAGDPGGATNIEFLKGQIFSTPVRVTRAYRITDGDEG
jgi:peptidyl-prolyl cis-trans isomerase A (cyclophilin A)